MKSDGKTLKPLKLHVRKNWLWLWILPTALSLLLVSLARPSGGAVFWIELAIICSSSCFFSFALAIKSFNTLQERFWGGLFFSGGSLCLISSVLSIGCHLYTPPSGASIRKERRKSEMQNKAPNSLQIVPRDAQADPTMLDLTSYYNDLLSGRPGWKQLGARTLIPGTHTWKGVKFDVRGMVVAQFRPDGRITGIRVGQKCSEIAFVHGSYEWFFQNEMFSRIVIHFANRHTESIPLVFGKDVDLSTFWNSGEAFNSETATSVVWRERSPDDDPHQPGLRLFIRKWKNPFPEETVTTIDVVPASRYANPFLVAITIRPVNP
jgi:hypothetical protein